MPFFLCSLCTLFKLARAILVFDTAMSLFLPHLYLLNTNTIKRAHIKKRKNNPLMHLILSTPADGDHCAASGLCDTLQTEPSLCSLTFPLMLRSSQSNTIKNKDHKQAMAFIPLKFTVQKRSFSSSQCRPLFGGSFAHSLPQRNMILAC